MQMNVSPQNAPLTRPKLLSCKAPLIQPWLSTAVRGFNCLATGSALYTARTQRFLI